MTLEEVKKALQDRRPYVVAEATGLHYNTIRAIRDDKDANPKAETLRKISDYLESRR